jgi:hypothetical protein
VFDQAADGRAEGVVEFAVEGSRGDRGIVEVGGVSLRLLEPAGT